MCNLSWEKVRLRYTTLRYTANSDHLSTKTTFTCSKGDHDCHCRARVIFATSERILMGFVLFESYSKCKSNEAQFSLKEILKTRQCVRKTVYGDELISTREFCRQALRQRFCRAALFLSFCKNRFCLSQWIIKLRGAWRDHRFAEPFSWFTRNRPWKSEDHLCTLFFIEMSKESLEKSKRTPPVSWSPWALAYSRDRPYNFSCLSAVSKNRRFRTFFSALGCHLARKSHSWPAMSVSNKKQEFEQRKRIKLFDDFWVRAYRFDFAPRRRPRARSI